MDLFAAIYTVRFVLDCTSYAKGSPKISFKKMLSLCLCYLHHTQILVLFFACLYKSKIG